ncbi:MAG: outer membrane beta-barrel protein [FCB group bacterium]|nr:outer membrane beta-barrel protein [FCB group bacterium]
MTTKRIAQSLVLLALLLVSSLAQAQYEEDPYIEVFVAGNYTLPTGFIKNDMVPDSLNAKAGIGLDVGIGYYYKPKLILGLYFNNRNMGVEGFDLKHRVFELGLFAKYTVSDLAQSSLSPYLRLGGGLNFSKLATKVTDDGNPVYRELSYDPAFAAEAALGLHIKTNSRGAVFLEAAYHMDMLSDVAGQFEGTDYKWGDNNNFMMFRVGVLFNISPKE